MNTLLQLNTSIFAAHGQSTHLNEAFVANWNKTHRNGQVIVRDFATDPIPHLTAERFQAFLAKPEGRTDGQREIVAYSDKLIDEIRRADVIVLGLPMYNYGIPSMLQSYFDHIGRAGVTFRYTENGPVGAFPGKKVYVFAARGGMHAGTARDTQIGQVRNFFQLIGITDVEVVYAEGMGMGDAAKTAGIARAKGQIIDLFAHVAARDEAVEALAQAA